MAQTVWEKTANTEVPSRQINQKKFFLGGLLILVAAAYLIISGTNAGARYFITIDNLLKDSKYAGQTVRVSGAVIGDSIKYDSENLIIEFTIVHVPQTSDEDLALALHNAVNNPESASIAVRVENQVKPDLLQHEAQAILTGTLDKNGVFQATELLLKCPSHFEESSPNSAISSSGE
jgi:cytochrome c-type biogenesis protein CcmE